jgi:hypothetical protein
MMRIEIILARVYKVSTTISSAFSIPNTAAFISSWDCRSLIFAKSRMSR